MKPVLIMTFTAPMPSESVIDQAKLLTGIAEFRDQLAAALPEGSTYSERIAKTGRNETRPRQRRVPRAVPAPQAAE